MSLQNSFISGTASSPKLLQTFNGKSYNGLLNQTSVPKKQNSYKTQARTFLKTELSSMIKDDLKSYRLQKKLEKQMQEFKRTNQKKKLIEDLHKVEKFRQQESQVLRSKFEVYQKSRQKKESVVEQTCVFKKDMVLKKKQQNDKKIESVRQRFFEYQNQDIQNRLSRADSILSHKSAHGQSSVTLRSKNIHESLNSRPLIESQTHNEEQFRITNYLKKIKHAESRILLKQLKNEERKQKSIKTQVKNLTRQKNLKQQAKMKQWQQKFDNKMGSFYQNFGRIQIQNSTVQMNKSRMKYEIREKVIRNKEMNDSLLVNKTLDNFMKRKTDKQNLYRNHQHKIDLVRTKSSFLNNKIQIHKQQLEKQKQKNIRILYQKLQRIKNLKSNQTLSEKERETLISLLDSQDPSYPEMIEFLNNTKSQFMKKKLQKEQQKAKADKTKKTARFYKN